MAQLNMTDAAEAYSGLFDNFNDLAHPSIVFKPEFYDLLQRAVDRGTPLTVAEVEQVFGKLNWEW